MDTRKKAIIEALTRFAEQRPGLDFRNYGSVPTFRSEQRAIARDLREARVLLAAAALDNRVTADGLLEAARSAFSGRLSIYICDAFKDSSRPIVKVDYCTGQYWPTEYRKAVCAVLASALWYAQRERMPTPSAHVVEWAHQWNGEKRVCDRSKPLSVHEATALRAKVNGGMVDLYRDPGTHKLLRAGDWLRAHFRRKFGAPIQRRWFN